MSLRRNVIVGGASHGIGRAVAVRFAADGDHVGLIGRSEDGLNETAALVRAVGGSSSSLLVDLADYEGTSRAIDELHTTLGALDVLWNGAFGYLEGPIDQLDMVAADELFKGGVLGSINLTRAFLRHASPNPIIMQVAADWSFPTNNGLAAFIAAKKAVEGFGLALQKELHGRARISIISPADVASQTHAHDASHETVIADTDGAAIAPSELAELCYHMTRYHSLFIHRVTVLPLRQRYDVTYA